LVENVVRNVVAELLPAGDSDPIIPVGVSARHIHVCQEHLEQLFGPGYRLTKLRDLNQPGEFAANETLSVVGPKRRLFEQVRILGPVRKITQVELSYSDGVYLGIDLPHRLSGDIAGSAPVILMGPQRVLNLPEGAIRAARHIHTSPEEAIRLKVEDGQKVSVESSGPLGVRFKNVVVRVGANLNLEMHIDTDEANAAGLRCGDPVHLIQKPAQKENTLVSLSRAV
jgi:propanediol utilization protein